QRVLSWAERALRGYRFGDGGIAPVRRDRRPGGRSLLTAPRAWSLSGPRLLRHGCDHVLAVDHVAACAAIRLRPTSAGRGIRDDVAPMHQYRPADRSSQRARWRSRREGQSRLEATECPWFPRRRRRRPECATPIAAW